MIAARTRRFATIAERSLEAPSDDALAALARDDGQAFALLYDRYVDPIYRYCCRRLGNEATAEDLTSLVFVRALSAIPRFEADRQSFRSWLFAIAHNAIVDSLRAAPSRVDRPLAAAAGLTDPSPSLDEAALASERRLALAEALPRLPDDQRQIVELRLAGLSGPEIAATLGKSHDAVRTAQRRAIVRLRSLLQVENDEEVCHG